MGASTFVEVASGSTAQSAFEKAVAAARYECGHGGYTGTIAEKHEFVMVAHEPMPEQDADALAYRLIDVEDRRVREKRGPAGCIPLLPAGRWMFFGWAAS